MLSKAKTWMGIGKPKNQHSLENLKYLYGILNKNQTVTENNKDLLIETLRSISEILIWGDQNDSSVFDFFLEKQMITFFLHYMKQKFGRYICVQLLQTLNILFENIRNETSLYFLLSNNHINNIILNKFDFADEEVMAYYISFLKTLSLKLNTHSIHFFFNERISEFPLYVEAIKFFDHPESMVRIAVRTLTLNVYRVPVAPMQKFIRDKTAIFYFSNLVWLIKNHVLDLDLCVKNVVDHTKKSRLTDFIDEYIDHLNYLQDIYMLNNEGLSNLLTEQLMRRLMIPVYLCSLLKRDKFIVKDRMPYIQPFVSLFLLSHLFQVITHGPLINDICEFLFNLNDEKVLDQMCFQKIRSNSINRPETDYLSEPKSLINCLSSLSLKRSRKHNNRASTRSRSMPHISPDSVKSEKMDTAAAATSSSNDNDSNEEYTDSNTDQAPDGFNLESKDLPDTYTDADNSHQSLMTNVMDKLIDPASDLDKSNTSNNITDDEKQRQMSGNASCIASVPKEPTIGNANGSLLFDKLMQYLTNQDYNELNSLLALSFISSLIENSGVNAKYIEMSKVQVNRPLDQYSNYHEALISKLIGIITKSVESEFKVRLTTLELAIKLIKKLVVTNGKSYINDFHLACIEQAREQSAFLLRRQFRTEEMFLDMFEHEYQSLNAQSINLEFLLRDWAILLTPISTPLSGIEFSRRFPSGDTEKLKQTIRIFFLLRDLCICLTNEKENQLPLTKQEHLVKENDALDLNSSDLIACTVNLKEKKDRRFLVMDPIQFILVEPEVKRIGWGIVKFSDLIQDVEVTPDKEDSRSLNITIKKSSVSLNGKPEIILNSIFTFDDHIRCMAAKQHLIRSRERARRMKLEKIAQLLDISSGASTTTTPNSKSFLGSSSASNSNIIGYNLVAGFNMLGTNYHPGRASMISQTWSQITGNEKSNSLANSPMTTLTSSPMVRNQHGPVSATNVTITPSATSATGYYRHQPFFSSPSLGQMLNGQSVNESMMKTASRQTSLSPNYDTAVDSLGISNLSDSLNQISVAKSKEPIVNTQEPNEKIEKRRSSVTNNEKQTVVKTLMTNPDRSISLIATDTDNELTSKIQILPPADHSEINNTSSSSFNYSKEKSGMSEEFY